MAVTEREQYFHKFVSDAGITTAPDVILKVLSGKLMCYPLTQLPEEYFKEALENAYPVDGLNVDERGIRMVRVFDLSSSVPV